MKQHYQLIAFLVIFCLINIQLLSQAPPVLVLDKIYPDFQSPKKLLSLGNGQLMIAGGCWYCLPGNLPGPSIMVVDTNGVMLWQKSYPNLSSYDEIVDIMPAASGGFWAVGHTENDALLMRLDAVGELLWEETYGGSSEEEGFTNLLELPDGNLVLVGTSRSSDGDLTSNQGEDDLWLLKVDTLGGVLWSKSFGSTGADVVKDVVLLPNGDVFLLAYPSWTGGDVQDNANHPWLLTLDGEGTVVSSKFLERQSPLNSMVRTAQSEWLGVGDDDYGTWVVRFSDNGDLLFDTIYVDNNPMDAVAIANFELGKNLLISTRQNYTPTQGYSYDIQLRGLDDEGLVNFTTSKDCYYTQERFEDVLILGDGQIFIVNWHHETNQAYQFGTRLLKYEFPVVPQLQVMPDTAICLGQPILLSANSPNCPYCQIIWTGISGNLVGAVGNNSEITSLTETTRFLVTATAAPGFTTTDTVEVQIINPDFRIDFNANLTCGPGTGSIEAVVEGANAAILSYTWSTGELTPINSNLAAGTYSVTVSDGTCSLSESITLNFDKKRTLKWGRTYGGSYDDASVSLSPMPDGGWLLGGISQSLDGDIGNNFGSNDIWLSRTNPDGEIVWAKSLGGPNSDIIGGLATTPSGNIWLAGRSGGGLPDFEGASLLKVAVKKLDENGQTVQSHLFDGNYDMFDIGIMAMPDDGAIFSVATASSEGFFGENHDQNVAYDPWLVRLDANGTPIWKKNYATHQNWYEIIEDMELLPDGGVLAAGRTSIGGNFSGDFWMFRTDAQGNMLWEKTLGGSGDESAQTVAVLSDGNYLWSGRTNSTDGDVGLPNGFWTDWLVKTDPNGNVIWKKFLPFLSGYSSFWKLTPASNGQVWLTTGPSSYQTSNLQYLLDVDGNVLETINLDPVRQIKDIENVPGTDDFAVLTYATEGYSIDGNSITQDIWLGRVSSAYYEIDALGADSVYCIGSTFTQTAKSHNCTSCTYAWEDGNTGASRILSPDENLLTHIVITSPEGCQGIDYQLLKEDKLTVELTVDGTNCGEANGSVIAKGKKPINDYTTMFGYAWSNGSNESSIDSLTTGLYSVTVSDGICEVTASAKIDYNEALKDGIWGYMSDTSGAYMNYHEATDGSIFALFGNDHGPNANPIQKGLQKFSSDGQLLWQKDLEPLVVDFVLTDDDGVMILSEVDWFNSFKLIKLDANGVVIWEEINSLPGVDNLLSIAKTPDGGNIWVGYGYNPNQPIPQVDGWVVKTDSLGEVLWSKQFGGSQTDGLYFVEPTDDGGYFIVGWTESGDGIFSLSTEQRNWVSKIDQMGNLIWTRTYHYGSYPYFQPFNKLQNGDYALGRYWYNSSGNLVKVFDAMQDLVQREDGSIVTINTETIGGGTHGGYYDTIGKTVGYDYSGNEIWQTPGYGLILKPLADGNFLKSFNFYKAAWGTGFSWSIQLYGLTKLKSPPLLPENHLPDTLLACLEMPYPLDAGNPDLPHVWSTPSGASSDSSQILWITQPGSYTVTMDNGVGCGDTYHYVVLAAPQGCLSTNNESIEICEGEFFLGQQFFSATTLTDTVYEQGLTTITSWNVNVLSSTETVLNDTICFGASYQIGPLTYASSGNFSFHLSGQNGCDSTVHLLLFVRPELAAIEYVYISLYPGNVLLGQTVYNDTTIIEQLSTWQGCDSTVVWTVDVVVNNTSENIGKTGIKAYPNPFSSHLSLEANSPIEAIEAVNVLGRRVAVSSDFHQNQLGKSQIVLSTINWQPGVYYIFARTSAQTSSPIKLVKY